MRKLLPVILFFAVSADASVISHTSTPATNGTATSIACTLTGVTAGDTLVMYTQVSNATITIADTGGATWHLTDSATDSSNHVMFMHYATAAATATDTITSTYVSGSGLTLCAAWDLSPNPLNVHGFGSGTTLTIVTTTPVTDIIVAGSYFLGATGLSAPFTTDETPQFDGCASPCRVGGHRSVSLAGSYTATFTLNSPIIMLGAAFGSGGVGVSRHHQGVW